MAQLFPPSPLHTRARTLVPLSNDSKTQTTNNAKCTPGSGKDRRQAAWFSEHQTLQESRCWWQGLQTKGLTGNLKELRWGSEVMELVLGSVPPEVLLPPAACIPSTNSTPGLPESCIWWVTDFLTGWTQSWGTLFWRCLPMLSAFPFSFTFWPAFCSLMFHYCIGPSPSTPPTWRGSLLPLWTMFYLICFFSSISGSGVCYFSIAAFSLPFESKINLCRNIPRWMINSFNINTCKPEEK